MAALSSQTIHACLAVAFQTQASSHPVTDECGVSAQATEIATTTSHNKKVSLLKNSRVVRILTYFRTVLCRRPTGKTNVLAFDDNVNLSLIIFISKPFALRTNPVTGLDY